jgi:hypothetical protein
MSIALDAAFPEKGCSSLHLGKINLGNETATVAFSFLPAASQPKRFQIERRSRC